MQFSESWLRALCNPALDTEGLCHLLTMAGLEVEEVQPAAPPFSGVLVAQIVSFEPHPNADKLKICRVDVGQAEILQIVCGAPNVVVGMKAPCAIVGAKLPGFDIKAAKLRGVESFGMMCSATEIGLTQDHDGLLVLPEDAPVGASVRDYLSLNDNSIVIKLTPNRPDCLSLSGIARELSALSDTPLTTVSVPTVAASIADVRKVHLGAPQACARYFGRVLKGVNSAAVTPDWMKTRLLRCGLRSISAVVDISNYVMLELGQPLHAFDNARLEGDIHVRFPQVGERLTLLNEQDVALQADMLLIADDARALALAGVMGGQNSGVEAGVTSDIFLESAFFAPDWIVGRARRLNFSSDASHRFERGVDPALAAQAMERATALILEICGGQAGPVVEAVDVAHLPAAAAVRVRPARVRQVLGIEVGDSAMRQVFERLAMQVQEDAGAFMVTAPSYRFDIAIEEDLIEEVARVFGYDNIPAIPPQAALSFLPEVEVSRPQMRVRRDVAARDYQEVINYAFVDEAWERDFAGNKTPIRLANPIASQMNVMRSSLMGGLISTLASNQRHRASRVRVFEVGRCFERSDAPQTVANFVQPLRLAGLAWGGAAPAQWGQADRRVDFFDVKADVQSILGCEPECRREAHPALHPGRSAALYVDGQRVGVMGELHPAWLQSYDLLTAPILFELDLDAVLKLRFPEHRDIARHPSAERDVALVMAADVAVGDLLKSLRAKSNDILRSIDVFDVYSGKGVEPGFKSVALRIVLQHNERTLADSEADEYVADLVREAGILCGAQLRA